ncbi:unnamed protein product, partial [Prorocentrum cordatum]
LGPCSSSSTARCLSKDITTSPCSSGPVLCSCSWLAATTWCRSSGRRCRWRAASGRSTSGRPPRPLSEDSEGAGGAGAPCPRCAGCVLGEGGASHTASLRQLGGGTERLV